MNSARLLVTFLLALTSLVSLAVAQLSTVYTTVVATKLFVVGAANPMTGLFFQHTSGDTTWRHSGPTTVRAFHAAVFRPSRGRIMYLAAGNGVHKTTDRGESWKITTDWKITEVLWVEPDQHDSNMVFIATPYGIYRTADGCATWHQMNRGLNGTIMTCVVCDRFDANKLYSGGEDGGYVSADRGETWTRLPLSVPGVRTIVQHPKDPSVLLAGTEDHGIYVSRNGGKTWTKSEAGVDHNTFYCFAFDMTNPDIVYAGGYVTGVYKSLDGARTWKRVNNGLTVLNIHSLAVDPAKSSRVYAAAYWGGIFKTEDGGESWANIGFNESQTWTVFVESN